MAIPRLSSLSFLRARSIRALCSWIFLLTTGCQGQFQLLNLAVSNPSKQSSSVEMTECKEPLTREQRGQVKFHPGHYVALGSKANVQEWLTQTLSEINQPALSSIVGVQKRYYWSSLHGPTRDDFNFEQMKKDIAEVAAAGKKLSIMILWKFKTDQGQNPVPAFLKELSETKIPYQYELNADGDFANGWIANLGNPVVARELKRLLYRIAQEVDSENAVSNIVFAESALGLKRENFSPPMSADDFLKLQDDYIDALTDVDKQSTCFFKHTPVLQLTNSPLRRMKDILPSYSQWSISMGGPDVWWNDASVEAVYEYYPSLEKNVPIGLIVAGGNFLYDSHAGETVPVAERTPYLLAGPNYNWTPTQVVINLAQKARTQLKANYLFWKKNGASGDEFYDAFKTEIAKTGTPGQTIGPLDASCPDNYSPQCVKTLSP